MQHEIEDDENEGDWKEYYAYRTKGSHKSHSFEAHRYKDLKLLCGLFV